MRIPARGNNMTESMTGRGKFLKTAEYAAKSGLSQRTIARLAENGTLKGYKTGYEWLIADNDLARLSVRRARSRPRRRPRK